MVAFMLYTWAIILAIIEGLRPLKNWNVCLLPIFFGKKKRKSRKTLELIMHQLCFIDFEGLCFGFLVVVPFFKFKWLQNRNFKLRENSLWWFTHTHKHFLANALVKCARQELFEKNTNCKMSKFKTGIHRKLINLYQAKLPPTFRLYLFDYHLCYRVKIISYSVLLSRLKSYNLKIWKYWTI